MAEINVMVTKGLLVFFIFSVTVWYLITPYLVRPHPQFKKDMYALMNSEESETSESKPYVENWTKWINNCGSQTIYSQQKQPLEEQAFCSFDWRKEYKTSIVNNAGQVTVDQSLPWYSKFGLYNHFSVETQNNTVKFVPNFMFGLPNSVVESMYGGADKIPISGMMTSSTSMDRFIIQIYMNIVTVGIIYLISIHNPRKKSETAKQE